MPQNESISAFLPDGHLMPPFDYLPEKTAVKMLIPVSSEALVTVAGKSGRVNLPGGGQRLNEGTIECLHRELTEEIGIGLDSFRHVEKGHSASAVVYNRARQQHERLIWQVYIGVLAVEPTTLHIPEGSEIKKLNHATTLDSLYDGQLVSQVAKMAVEANWQRGQALYSEA